MSKSVKTFIAVAAMLAVAAPAMADFKFSGEFRIQGHHQTTADARGGVFSDDVQSENLIHQRFRPKLDYRVNDLISLTYFGEIDIVWGEQLAPGGNDGRVGADGYNLQTKNVYLDLKIPQIDSSLRLGVQGVRDPFNGVVFFDDMAAANMTGKLGLVDYQLLYSKWDQPSRVTEDDLDFYGLNVSHSYGDFAKAGVAAYYLNETDTKSEIWYGGLYGDYRFANFILNGFGVYQWGELDDNTVNTEAWTASVKGAMVLPNGDVGLRYIYFSPDDSTDDFDRWIGFQGAYEFTDENLMLFLVDKWVVHEGKNRRALVDAVEGGYGLHALVASGNFRNLPMNTYANLGAGAFFVADRNPDGAAQANTTLGYELAARVGKVFADKFDLSLRGAYAFLGDFYDTDANNNDADDIYTVGLMARVPF